MDDYKEQLIELVRVRPILWDPRFPDYKDKEQKVQVWDELKKLLTAPKGITLTPKEVWEGLIRCHGNALRRTMKKKKSGSGAANPKPWKFLGQMNFLIPVKEMRSSKGNLPQASDEETDSDTKTDTLQAAVSYADIVNEADGVDVPEQAIAVAEKRQESEQEGRKRKKRKAEDNEDVFMSLVRAKLERTHESPRMGFFHSIMPRIETLNEDLFQEFQLQTLELLKHLHSQTEQGHFYAQSGRHSP